jgi:hypothetical protein
VEQRAVSAAWAQTFRLLGLMVALGLAFYMGMLPKADARAPTHTDEWLHYAFAQRTLEERELSFEDPVSARRAINRHHEAGFHTLLASVKATTELPWTVIFRYFPSIFFCVTVFLAYLFGRRAGHGVESAMLVALVPTTLRVLGPAFLVPMAMGLLLLPTVLFVIQRFGFTIRSSFLLWLLLLFLFTAHPVSGLLLSLVVGISLVLFLGHAVRSGLLSLRMTLVALLGLAATVSLVTAWQLPLIRSQSGRIEDLTNDPGLPVILGEIYGLYGFLPLGLFVLGVFLLLGRRHWAANALVGSAIALLLLHYLYARQIFGDQTVADRGMLMLITLMGLVGGYALAEVRRLGPSLARVLHRPPAWGYALARLATVSLLVLAIAQALPQRQEERYYHIISDPVYRDALWVRDYVETPRPLYKVVLHPAYGIAFAPLSGRTVLASSSDPFSDPPKWVEQNMKIYTAKLPEGELTGHHIAILYDALLDRDDPANRYLIQPRPNIHLVRPITE